MKRTIFAFVSLSIMISCTDENNLNGNLGEDKIIHVTDISLNTAKGTIKEGETIILIPTIIPANATNKNIIWSCSDKSLASVKDGTVVGIKAGQVIIIATSEDGEKMATCLLTIERNLAPSVTIGVEQVSAISAVLIGKANLGSTVTSDLEIGFQLSKSAEILPSNFETIKATEVDSDYSYFACVIGLESDTQYYFRSYVRKNGHDTYGEIKKFKTKDKTAFIETKEASEIDTDMATLNAKLDLTDIPYRYLSYGFNYGLDPTTSYYSIGGLEIQGNSFSSSLTGLNHNTQYWYQAYAIIDDKYFYGDVLSFTTKKSITDITVAPDRIMLTSTGAVTKTVSLTTSRNWTLTSKPDWVVVNPSSGNGFEFAQDVTLTFNPNLNYDREGVIIFSNGINEASLIVGQKGEAGELLSGSGTRNDPYSVKGVLAFLNTLGNEVYDPDVYIKGIISRISETYTASGTHGNATFYIKDAADASEEFLCYRTLYLGNNKFTSGKTDIHVGDDVIVCGKVINYLHSSGTVIPETVTNEAYLYSLNGTTAQVQTEITDATVAEFINSDGASYYRLTGRVSSFSKGVNSSGNTWMQFNLTDATGTILVYGFMDGQYDAWNEIIKDGGTVVLTGTYQFFSSKNQHEVMNTTIESFEEGQEQTEFEDLTVAQFIGKANGAVAYRLTGVVTGFYTGKTSGGKDYMGFDLTDNTGTIKIYGFKDGQFAEWSTKIKDGGSVKLHGFYYRFRNSDGSVTHEVMNAVIEEFSEGADYKFCKVSPEKIYVKADATNATFAIKSNAFWTVTSDNPDFSITPSSGDTNATVTVSFTANTSETEPREANFAVKCEAASVENTVVLIQGKVSTSGNKIVVFDYDSATGIPVTTSGSACSTTLEGIRLDLESGARNENNKDIRVYKDKKMTISATAATGLISKIVITSKGSSNGTNKFGAGAPSGYAATATEGVWESSAAKVEFTASDAQVRMLSITVTYTE